MENESLVLEDATIIFRNLGGKPDNYNPNGKRTFSIALDPGYAEQLAADGWNIKRREPKTPDGDPLYLLPVEARFDGPRPPRVFLISGGKKVLLTEDTVASIDYAEIENVDLVVVPYHWHMGAKEGTKAYLKSMYVTVVEDEFAKKYDEYDDDEVEIPFS